MEHVPRYNLVVWFVPLNRQLQAGQALPQVDTIIVIILIRQISIQLISMTRDSLL